MASPDGARGMQARGLRVVLGGAVVLDGVDLEVPRARMTALLAPSGAGKSTLLRCLVGLVAPDAGAVTLDGADIATLDARALRRRVGLVAQAPVMLEGTVADNLRYANTAIGDDDVERSLDAAGLEARFAPRVARELSGGERTRVALARALARDPELLLLDEPTAALDDAAAEQVGRTLRRLRDEGHGICLATHDERAATWADRLERLE